MAYVGLDPSYTGFAMAAIGDGFYTTGVCWTEPAEFPCHYARLEHIRQSVIDFVDDVAPWSIAIEGYSFGSKQGREQAGELGGLVRWALWTSGYGFIVVPPTTLKAYVTGKGNAEKSLMMREVFRKWGYEASDDNDADAYALAQFAMEMAHGRDVWTKRFEALASKILVVRPARRDEADQA